MKDWMMELTEQYMKVTGGELVPLMQIRGNPIFEEKFGWDLAALYLYCIEKKVKWEDVLEVSLDIFDDPNIQS